MIPTAIFGIENNALLALTALLTGAGAPADSGSH